MKIDTSKIQGFEGMTAEQKVEALLAHEMEADYTGYVQKATFDSTASELAEMKKKYTSLLSAEEKKKLEDKEALDALHKELETLRKEKTISEHKSRLIALGYDETLAVETANAIVDGDMQKVFDNQKKFLEIHDQTTKENLLKGTPSPKGGGNTSIDYDKKIAEANARGDQVSVAYFTRLKFEASQTK